MADTKIIQTSADISVDFTETETALARHFVFEMDDVPDENANINGSVRIRKYPAENSAIAGDDVAELADSLIYGVTQGSLVFTQEVRIKDVVGFAEFTGNDRVRLPYPILNPGVPAYSGIPGLELQKAGSFYNAYGQLISPTIAVNWATGELVASEPCYGGVDYGYATDYRILRYTPRLHHNLFSGFSWHNEDYGALIAAYRIPFIVAGTRIVVEPPPPIMFKIQPPESMNIEFELYRIESSVIVNEDGTWERPMGWPATGTYPSSALEVDAEDPHLEVTRVHEIAHFSLQNFDSRNSNHKSVYGNVPLNFRVIEERGAKREMIRDDNGRINYDNPNQEYFRRIRDFRVPKMRITRFEHRLQKPYEAQTWPSPERQVIATKITFGGQVNQTFVEATKVFRIKLAVKVGRAPYNDGVKVTAENRNQQNAALQTAIINTQLHRAWKAIDWAMVIKSLRAQYPSWLYEVDYSEITALLSD